jgi:hypothetical protein
MIKQIAFFGGSVPVLRTHHVRTLVGVRTALSNYHVVLIDLPISLPSLGIWKREIFAFPDSKSVFFAGKSRGKNLLFGRLSSQQASQLAHRKQRCEMGSWIHAILV